MAHSDVVPAAGEWDHPPFAGEIADGCVWGRGAMDTKGSLCALFNAVEELLAEGFTPPCDVYLASSNNEEIMGDGAPNTVTWLTDHGVKLDLVLDEGGAVIEAPMPGLNGKYAMLGVLEKGYADVRFTAVSAGGHSSTPPKGTPLARLAAFVNRVETRPPFPVKITPPVKAMVADAVWVWYNNRTLVRLFGVLAKTLRAVAWRFAQQPSGCCLATYGYSGRCSNGSFPRSAGRRGRCCTPPARLPWHRAATRPMSSRRRPA